MKTMSSVARLPAAPGANGQPVDVDVPGDAVDEPADRQRVGVADGVGHGDLVHAPIGDLLHHGHCFVRRDRPLDRANPGRHHVEARPQAGRLRPRHQAARRGHGLSGRVVGIAPAEGLADGRAKGQRPATAEHGPVEAAVIEDQPG